jgi:hypothetical protein
MRCEHILISSTFTSRPISILATNKVSVFFFIVCMLPPNILTSPTTLEADLYHLFSSPPGLPEPS